MIETARLNLHPAARGEMEALIEAQTDDILKTAYCEMLDGCLCHQAQWDWYAIWIIERKDGAHVGELCFKGVSGGRAEIGYGIGAEYRGCGYATEAVAAAVAWALHQSECVCVEAETEQENAASRRVLEKCGFAPTGKIGEEGPRFAITYLQSEETGI